MPFLDEKSGTLTFDNGVRLNGDMEKSELLTMLRKLGGVAPDAGLSGVLPFPACPVAGGVLAPVCILQEDRLQSVSLTVVSVGQKAAPSAEQQRSFLFRCFSAKDPCPDTLRNCILGCAFGSIAFCTDPRLGNAIAHVTYQPE